MTEPFVSVLIVGRNVGRYIRETVESALGQTWQRREVIVVDDGSVDDTSDVLRSFGNRIRLISRPGEGLAAGRNAGLAVAKGEYVALLDADDLWLPRNLEVQVGVALRHPESGLVACDGIEFGPEGTLRPHLLSGTLRQRIDQAGGREYTGQCHELFVDFPPFSCPAQTLIPRAVFERLGGFANLTEQDYEYYLRISQEYPVTAHAESLTRWRYRPEGLSGPREGRAITWSLDDQLVLAWHARSCNSPERAHIRRRRRELARQVAVRALAMADEGDRDGAVRILKRLLQVGPWPPIAVVYQAALYSPSALRRLVGRVQRRLGRRSKRVEEGRGLSKS